MASEVQRQWLSVKELMALTGLGRSKCYSMISSVELEAIKAGRSVRVSRQSIEEWASRRRYMDVVGE